MVTDDGFRWTEMSCSGADLELLFDQEVDQEGNELDLANKQIYDTYGYDVEIDWRDGQTCWVSFPGEDV